MIAATKPNPGQQYLKGQAHAETYQDVENLVWKTVIGFNRRHGGDIEEQMGIANLAFTEALEKHDPERAQFTTILVLQIRWKLLASLRKRINQGTARESIMQRWPNKRGPLAGRPVDENSETNINYLPDRADRSPFDAEVFCDDASDDAQQLLSFIGEFGNELRQEVRGKPRSMRDMLVDALRAMGWTVGRITESFGEIREALR